MSVMQLPQQAQLTICLYVYDKIMIENQKKGKICKSTKKFVLKSPS